MNIDAMLAALSDDTNVLIVSGDFLRRVRDLLGAARLVVETDGAYDIEYLKETYNAFMTDKSVDPVSYAEDDRKTTSFRGVPIKIKNTQQSCKET